MAQLDIYIISNLLITVILAFIISYIINIYRFLILINLVIRTREFWLSLEKNKIYNILKENLKNKDLKYYKFYFFLKIEEILFLNKDLVLENLLDLNNLNLINIPNFYIENNIKDDNEFDTGDIINPENN